MEGDRLCLRDFLDRFGSGLKDLIINENEHWNGSTLSEQTYDRVGAFGDGGQMLSVLLSRCSLRLHVSQ